MDQEESTCTPRIFILFWQVIGTLWTQILRGWRRDTVRGEPTIKEKDLEEFRWRPFAADQSAICCRSEFMEEETDWISEDLKDFKRITSSAYMYNWEVNWRDSRSATKMLKSRGPRIEPCGTPEETGRGEEKVGRDLWTRTCWRRDENKKRKQWKKKMETCCSRAT